MFDHKASATPKPAPICWPVQIGLVQIGLVQIGLVQIGLVQIGLVQISPT
ncbi:hypothetical protein ABIA31_003690 [Catenulispora sp. MAP5-51]